MCLTGFDAPCLHTMYLDKPMRGRGRSGARSCAHVNRKMCTRNDQNRLTFSSVHGQRGATTCTSASADRRRQVELPKQPTPSGAGPSEWPLDGLQGGQNRRSPPRQGKRRLFTAPNLATLPGRRFQGELQRTAPAPATATAWSFSTVLPDTPMPPMTSPLLFLIGTPPGNVISPLLECSIL